jgi:predicted methyltransferase
LAVCGDRIEVGGASVTDHRLLALIELPDVNERSMYDQSILSELTRFARIEAGSTVIDVYSGDGDWTRLFSEAVGRRPGLGSVVNKVARSHFG